MVGMERETEARSGRTCVQSSRVSTVAGWSVVLSGGDTTSLEAFWTLCGGCLVVKMMGGDVQLVFI